MKSTEDNPPIRPDDGAGGDRRRDDEDDGSALYYRVDAEDRIVSVGGGWDEFASAGQAEELIGEGPIGRSLWSYVVDESSRRAYRRLLDRVRSTSDPVSLHLRCDAPDVRRSIQLRMVPEAGGVVRFVSRTLKEERREPVAVLDPAPRSTADLVHACSWCQRVHLPGAGWLDVEAAAARLDRDDGSSAPRLSHGMCQDCWDGAVEELDRQPGGEDLD